MKSGQPRLLTFGVADEDAWEVGLACGGTIQVFVEPFAAWESIYGSLNRHLEARDPLAVVGLLDGPEEHLRHKLIVLADRRTEGNLDIPGQREQIVGVALEALAQGEGRTLALEGDLTLFVEVYPSAPRLIIVGAVHIAEALVQLARPVGFDTIIIDPRAAFNTPERFPDATQRIRDWPQNALPALALDGSAYVVVLTHDPKLDDPALQIALQSHARYVGALGSERTARMRRERLRRAGLTDEQIARLHAPVGLPLGGRSPAEIALSILAEIVQAKSGVLSHSPAD